MDYGGSTIFPVLGILMEAKNLVKLQTVSGKYINVPY
jgi:hypothetical protein